MIRIYLFILSGFIAVSGLSQPIVETSDIDRFWDMYDGLSGDGTLQDSLDRIQREYLDQASPAFAKFIRFRKFTASEYQQWIASFPGFWQSVRPLTEAIAYRKEEIIAVLDSLSAVLPGFRMPEVCFSIGCLRTGGTTSHDLILIGAEIAASDSTVDKRGMGDWHQQVLGQSGDIVSMVAHEAVHTCQRGFPFFEIFSLIRHRKLRLLNMAIAEGSADFVTETFLGLNINRKVHQYGSLHQCQLVREFTSDIATAPFDYKNWLYNGNLTGGRPPDLGYYMGSLICSGYYKQAADKRQALKTMLHLGQYKKVFKNSGFGCPDAFQ